MMIRLKYAPMWEVVKDDKTFYYHHNDKDRAIYHNSAVDVEPIKKWVVMDQDYFIGLWQSKEDFAEAIFEEEKDAALFVYVDDLIREIKLKNTVDQEKVERLLEFRTETNSRSSRMILAFSEYLPLNAHNAVVCLESVKNILKESTEIEKATYVIRHVEDTNCLMIQDIENEERDYLDYKFYSMTESPESMGEKEFIEMLEKDAKKMMRKNDISEATLDLSHLPNGEKAVLKVEEKKKKQQFEMER